ncbi:hypothetical protein Ddye_027663 [Dipteronia dyeriana]|uniref:Retrotransposon Copia-like N-terminal domain-containing protein n=1 Tax=Dipteronia dyeriana TaxID=168575 RepID=A0AAD9TPZ7_9ROSI|nr:hypothetical protein Ddye_027663 [Dipteronia dyeriana]
MNFLQALKVTPGSNSSMSKSSIDDSSSPYFLHHSDNPGLILVPQPLTEDNYASWSRAMLIALSVKNKLGFIDGSIQKPSEGSDLIELTSWIRNNNIVISWILNSVSKEISASVIYSESAHEIWLDLKERFQQRNGPRIFQLRRDLMNNVQGQNSVSTYYRKLKAIWEELNNYRPVCSCGKCTCGGTKALVDHYNMEFVMSFLNGLNDSFTQVRGQLLAMDPIPSINKVFAIVSQEENQQQQQQQQQQRGIIGVRNDAMRFNSNRLSSSSSPSSSSPNNISHQKKKERLICVHCGCIGHTIERCYKLLGYPPPPVCSCGKVHVFTKHNSPSCSTTTTSLFPLLSKMAVLNIHNSP